MEIPYRLIRSDRKTLAIRILPSGEVVVRCPRHLPAAVAQDFVQQKSDWIRRKLAGRCPAAPVDPFTPAELDALKARARSVIPARVELFAREMGVSYGTVAIRAQRSRWGSCSKQGNLNFNCLLMLAPAQVLDYVVVHELCHRLEMNHSARFWSLVARVMPDYAGCRRWLQENGSSLIARLPKGS